MTIQVLNGANLGRLGLREPDKYGTTTYAELVELIAVTGRELGLEVQVRQTDDEGELLRWVHAAADAGDPVVINPAGWSHTSVVLRDALAQLNAPLVEVHITNIHSPRGVPAPLLRLRRRRRRDRGPGRAGLRAGAGLAGQPGRAMSRTAQRRDALRATAAASGAGRRPRDEPAQRALPDRLHRLERRAAGHADRRRRPLRHRRPVHHPGRRRRCPTSSCWSTAAPCRRWPARPRRAGSAGSASSRTTSPSTGSPRWRRCCAEAAGGHGARAGLDPPRGRGPAGDQGRRRDRGAAPRLRRRRPGAGRARRRGGAAARAHRAARSAASSTPGC